MLSEDSVTHRMNTEGVDLLTLAGVNDANLIELARLTGAKVTLRGDTLTLAGPSATVERATPVAQRMLDTARQELPLTPDDVLRISEEVATDGVPGGNGTGGGGGGGAPAGEQRIVLPGVGAFGIVFLVRERSADGSVVGEATALSQWAGIGRSHPVLAVTFTLFLLSFAGIPLTAGFIGKFAVFSAAVAGGAWPLALVGVLASAAAAFFYVRIIVLMFFTDAQGEADGEPAASASAAPVAGPDTGGYAVAVAERTTERTTTTMVVGTEGFAAVAIAVCAIVTLAVGLFPTPVLDLIGNVAKFLP